MLIFIKKFILLFIIYNLVISCNHNKKKSFLINIVGRSGSGKTTIAKNLAEKIKLDLKKNVVIISMDNYYKKIKLSKLYVSKINFYFPEMFDFIKLKNDLKTLYHGGCIKQKIYQYAVLTKEDKFETICHANIIILEGIFSLYDKNIVNMSDVKFYINTKIDTALNRRLERDSIRYDDKNYQKDTIIRWNRDVEPAAKTYIENNVKQYQPIIVFNDNQNISKNIDFMISEIIKNKNYEK